VKPPGTRTKGSIAIVFCAVAAAVVQGSTALQAQTGITWLPASPAFELPLADPLAPRFAGTLGMTDIFTRPLYGNRPDAVRDATGAEPQALVNLGGVLPLVGARFHQDCTLAWSVEAMVMGRFRLRTTEALSNDWWVGLPVAATCGPASVQVRPYHRSDHLSDEFLLLNDMNRRGPVQDGVDATMSWRPHPEFRVYAGAGHIFRGYWGPFGSSAHGGAEYARPLAAHTKLFIAVHLRSTQVADWAAQRALAAGLEYRGGDGLLRLALRDVSGPSTLGEFFMDEERLFGLEITYVPGGYRPRPE
jgi:hypothetical protein